MALGEVAYIALVVSFMSQGEQIFEGKPELLLGMTMLTLLVVSTSVSGALVLGRPIFLFLEGRRREAMILFSSILGWLLSFLLIFILSIFFFRG